MKKNIFLYLFLFLLNSQYLIFSQTVTDKATSQIKHIRWGSNGNPLDGVTITWSSIGKDDTIKWGYTPEFEEGIFNGIKRQGYADTFNFFNYYFPKLKSKSTLYYQIYDSKNDVWTETKTFKTANDLNTKEFTFVATGDSRGGAVVWNQISNLAKSKNPDFTVFNGDMVRDAAITDEWDEWFDSGDKFIESNLILYALGNHDALSVPNYLNTFELPLSNGKTGTELYYAFEYGEAVFISLNSEDPEDKVQYNWLLSTLKANASKKWKIILFHKPFYTIGPHEGEMDDYFSTWWKAFDDYGVDLILNGHDHMYERTKPINRNVSTTSPVANYGSKPGEGRCEVVCAGAGAGLTNLTSGWFIESYKKSHNFCKFDVTSTSMCGTVYDEKDLVIDSFCLNKSQLSTDDNFTQIFYPIKIIPNPVINSFKIDYSSPNMGEVKINILDVSGKLVNSIKSTKSNNEFTFEYDATNLQAGTYFVEIEMGKQKDHAIIIRK